MESCSSLPRLCLLSSDMAQLLVGPIHYLSEILYSITVAWEHIWIHIALGCAASVHSHVLVPARALVLFLEPNEFCT